MRTYLLLSVALLVSPLSVPAVTIHVPGDVPTLAWALNVAQNGDSIVVAPGTYSGPGWAGVTQAADLVFITSSGGRDVTTIDLGSTYFVEASSDVRLDGFTIAGGTSDALIDINPGFVFVENCRFADSPGVVVDAESVTMTNTIVERCRRAAIGLSITTTTCTFEDMTEPVLEVLDGALTATGCVFVGSASHAAVGTNHSSISLTSCDVSDGSDVAIVGVQNGTITLAGSTFEGNTSALGTVARVGSFVTLTATDCVFASNSASGAGGVVSLLGDFSDAVFQNCTLVGNGAPSGAVVHLELADANSDVTFANSILVSNTGGELVSGPFGFSDITVSCTDAWNNASGDWVGLLSGRESTNDNISVDPLFCGMAASDPWTLQDDSPLLPGSHPRCADCGLIGARDVGCAARGGSATIVVDASGGGDFLTVQEGIDASSPGDMVRVMPGTYGPAPGAHNVAFITHAIILIADAGPDVTFLDGEGTARGVGLFDFCDPSCTIVGFSIINGNQGVGGGVYAGAPATFANCIIAGNTATDGSGTGNGGGFVTTGGVAVRLEGCVVSGNLADDVGGGVFAKGASQITAINTTVSGNAAGNAGGGIAVHPSASVAYTWSIAWGNCAPSGADAYAAGPMTLTCSDVDLEEVFGAPFVDPGSFSADPLFCEPIDCGTAPTLAGDLQLSDTSPCLASATPCGLTIGARGVACSIVAVGEASPVPRPLLDVSPNPLRSATTFLLDPNRSPGLRLVVYDVGGRSVREIPISEKTAAVRWDGTDNQGRRLTSGVYFVRASTPGGTLEERRVVILR